MNAALVEGCRNALQMGVALLLQSGLLLLLGLMAGWLLRRRGPERRAFVSQMTLAGVALGAVLSVTLSGHVQPVWGVRLGTPRPMGTPPSRLGSPPPPAGEDGRSDGQGAGPIRQFQSAVLPPPPRNGPLLAKPRQRGEEVASLSETEGSPLPEGSLALLWPAVTGLLLLWLLACQGHLTRLRRAASPVTVGPAAEALAHLSALRRVRAPLLLQSQHVRSPFLAGLRRPAIFFPSTWEADYDDATLRAVLAHELAHLTRRDCTWTLLLRLTMALLWPQPLLWLLARQLDQATEEACDLLAVTPDCPPRRYADCLLRLADRALPGPAARTLGAGVVPVRSTLGRRIQTLLDRRNHTMTPISTRLRVAATLGAAIVAVAGALLISTSAPAQENAPPVSSVVGTWRGHPSGNKSDTETVTFQADGQVVDFDPGAGGHSYGTYAVAGDNLTFSITRQEHGAGTPATLNRLPHTGTLRFKIVGDSLTVVNTQSKYNNTLTRLSSAEASAAATSSDLTSVMSVRKKLLADLKAVQGPGVTVTIQPGAVGPGAYADTTLNDVINGLRSAGAEAAAVNGVRLGFSSAITSRGNDVYVNGERMSAPYVVKAIGDPSALQNALSGVIKSAPSSEVSVAASSLLELPGGEDAAGYKYLSYKYLRHTTPSSQPSGERGAVQSTAHAALVSLERARAQVQLQSQVAARSAQTYRRLARQAGPPPAQPDSGARPQLQELRTQIAQAQADLVYLSYFYTRSNPKYRVAKARVQALQAELAYLVRHAGVTRLPNAQYYALLSQADAATAEVTRAQVTVSALDAQIKRLRRGL